MIIRVRGGAPKRDIAVPGRVVAGRLGYACRVRVQTPGLKDLTDAACMPDLTVEEYGGRKRAKPSARVMLLLLLWAGHRSEAMDEGFVQYILHSTLECPDGQRDF